MLFEGRSIHNDEAYLPEIVPSRVKSKLTDAETQRSVWNVIGIYPIFLQLALKSEFIMSRRRSI